MADYLITGVGGQGIVLSSRLLAQAAMRRGLAVRTAETIGMSQRGGSVSSHVRSGSQIHSPLIPLGQAEVLIAFEPAEALRCLPYLKKDGALISLAEPVQAVSSALSGRPYDAAVFGERLLGRAGKTVLCSSAALIAELGQARFVNVALLGTALRLGLLDFSATELEQALALLLKPQYLEKNRLALQRGLDVVAQNFS